MNFSFSRNFYYDKLSRFLILIFDIILASSAFFIAFYFSTKGNYIYEYNTLIISLFSVIIFLFFLYYFSGVYKVLPSYVGSFFIYFLATRNLALTLFTFIIFKFFSLNNIGWDFFILFWFLTTFFISSFRLVLRDLLIFFKKKDKSFSIKEKVVIYGAGDAGGKLSIALNREKRVIIKFFIDDDPSVWGRRINDIPIYSPKFLKENKYEINTVLIAMPSVKREKRILRIKEIQKLGYKVLQIPTLSEIVNGNTTISKLKKIEIGDILGRDTVQPDPEIIKKSIYNAVVLVSGAGGSIGSELCKQIILQKPSSLILLEISEPSLYKVLMDLEEINTNNSLIKGVLGSACDEDLIHNIFRNNNIDLVFHAAAYKHVPLVENNPIEGIKNNVMSTKFLCQASYKNKINRFVLISSDKAVRPTNVMGCSKRIAELIVKSYSSLSKNQIIDSKKENTIFSSVRFGNVLESSGSVVPLFRRQIEKGGPITITDKRVIRYFMTITEAVDLVIQAAFLSKNGDVCLLEMGEPLKIYDLAKQMIMLSGLQIKNEQNPKGDIEIITTGLRPGEKLFEELLVEGQSQPTSHPLIYRSQEENIDQDLFLNKLEKLISSLNYFDKKKLFSMISDLVPEWKVDKIHEIE